MKDPIKRILVTTDGSEESESVFPAIMPIVRAYAPEVAVLYVFEEPESSFMPPARLSKACAALRATNVNAYLELREGVPAEEILRAARDKNSDLIAISTHGRDGVVRMIAGSVTEEVLRKAQVPVLVTHAATPVQEWKRIVVALDGSERSESILGEAVILAKKMGAALELLHVVHPVIAGAAGETPIVLPPEDPTPYMKGLLDRVAQEGIQAHAAILEGRTSDAILRHLEQSAASLLCMTTHGRTGLARLFLGSVAEEVLRKARCPVFLRRNVPAPKTAMKAGTKRSVTVY